jgi:DNA-binding transcriptional MerR regulator/effector-binding domain-containing protein
MGFVSETPLLRIGPFSRASSLSIKALRAYHEAGLLVPDQVDPQSGYRSYSLAQLTDAAVIRQLRDLDVPLEAIRDVLDARDPDATGKVLAEHGAVLRDRLAATQRAIDALYLAIESPSVHTPVHRRWEPAQTVLAMSAIVAEPEFLAFFLRAGELLLDALAASGAVADGPFGACYPPMLDDDHQEVEVFVPVTRAALVPAAFRAEGVRVTELPATDVAVVVHNGSYEGLTDTYRNLGAWVAIHAEAAELPVRELYVIGPDKTDDPDRYRTDVLWPVTGPSQPGGR